MDELKTRLLQKSADLGFSAPVDDKTFRNIFHYAEQQMIRVLGWGM